MNHNTELSRIIHHLQNIHNPLKYNKWILKNINKNNFFDIISFQYTQYLLQVLIIFRKGSFYSQLKKLLVVWNNYIEQCQEVKQDHTNKREKKWYPSGLYVVPYNIPRRPFFIIHDGYCIYEKHRIVTSCTFTHFSNVTITKRQVKYQNQCFYCNCRYTKSHNTSTQHIQQFARFFSLLDSIQPFPVELWQYIIHFLYE